MIALKAAKSAVVIVFHCASLTTFVVNPRAVVASANSLNSNLSTKRRSSANTEVARVANKPPVENFIVVRIMKVAGFYQDNYLCEENETSVIMI